MSRIRGFEAKIQKEVLQTRLYARKDNQGKNNEEQSISGTASKDDAEKQQICELLAKLPRLERVFSVHRKIGEGTFSSVYLGSLRAHASLPPASRSWFAIKHLVPTAHPKRIEHELRCLRDMGGKNNVIGVDLCLRNMDTIVFVMPYIPHRKFTEYVGEMDAAELAAYMRALLTALRHVHSFGVIHRDVKPSNFLYDRDNRRYLLVDFGLAQRVCPAPSPEPASAPAPAPAKAPPPAHAHALRSSAVKRQRDEQGESTTAAKRLALELSVGRASATPAPAPAPAHTLAPAPLPKTVPASVPTPSLATATATSIATPSPDPALVGVGEGVGGDGGGGVGGGGCSCAGVGGVCSVCAERPLPRAPRAGTQGFRPPEVLLKVHGQSTAVDVWAAGVVLVSVLTARYPFFRACGDAAALAELADLLGTEPLQKAASAMGRRVVVSSPRRGLCLRRLSARLRGAALPPRPSPAQPPQPPPLSACACAHCRLPQLQCLCRDEAVEASEWRSGESVAGFPDAAFALCAQLLEPDPRRRPTAAHALQHPFLQMHSHAQSL